MVERKILSLLGCAAVLTGQQWAAPEMGLGKTNCASLLEATPTTGTGPAASLFSVQVTAPERRNMSNSGDAGMNPKVLVRFPGWS